MDISFVAALLLLAAILCLAFQNRNRLEAMYSWTNHTYEALSTLDELNLAMLQAESSRRGYVLTGKAQFKEQSLVNVRKASVLLEQLRELTKDNQLQQVRIGKLTPLLERKAVLFAKSMAVFEKGGRLDPVQARITEEGSVLMLMIQSGIGEMKIQEQTLLVERRKGQKLSMSYLFLVMVGGMVAAMTILSLAYLLARHEASENQKVAEALEEANLDMATLSEMTQFLQICSDLGEARRILSSFGSRFFSRDAGGIYLINSSRNLAEEAATWGEGHSDVFGPTQCWALRLGQPYSADHACDVGCPHKAKGAKANICVPLAAHHETMGVLHISFNTVLSPAALEKKRQLAVAFAEQVALALRNLQLREKLRELSIRDPLTGLLNRRYMEESLARELSRANRKGCTIGLVMIDVDYFKSLNDRFGHDAGDRVLKEFGYLLQNLTRGSDVACRFGGEEFTLILPETTKQGATEKANMLRKAVKELDLVMGQHLGQITISAGVASFPEDGETAAQLLAAADSALYRAKKGGRDRVEESQIYKEGVRELSESGIRVKGSLDDFVEIG
ncbi:GGDEF domain-containing protein [Geomonas sp. Red276]